MPDWIEPLINTVARDTAAVLVTVVSVAGSVPREVGATLVVSSHGINGTIGGGNLEHTAIVEARAMLSGVRSEVSGEQTCRRYSLGPSLGQCCGGRVELFFEHITAHTRWLEDVSRRLHQPMSGEYLCRCIDTVDVVISVPEDFLIQRSIKTGPDSSAPAATGVFEAETMLGPSLLTSKHDNTRWYCTPLHKRVPEVWVYGAGHVGQAVVAQLSLLSCEITLLDSREEWLAQQPDLKINRILTDSPADEIDKASASTYHVVMTHSHAIDFDICLAVLKNDSFQWLGLIGSETKRRTFKNRLEHRGIDAACIARMRCPIGSLPLESSEPSVIALNLAAELASLWESTATIQ